ncbi:hypothetical protein Tco_0102633, partial [Tanacetum coccineum]
LLGRNFNYDIDDFEERLGKIFGRGIHRVQVLDFGGLPDQMAEGLRARMLMEHKDDLGENLERQFLVWIRPWHYSSSWVALGDIPDKGDLSAYWIWISSEGDFFGSAPSYIAIRDHMLRLCHRLIACNIAGRSQAPEKVTVTDLFYLRGMDVDSVNIPYLLARYLRRFASRRKRGALISGG